MSYTKCYLLEKKKPTLNTESDSIRAKLYLFKQILLMKITPRTAYITLLNRCFLVT